MSSSADKLSDRKLKAILGKPQDKAHTLADGKGLSARISKNGNIAWLYRYRLAGGRNENAKWLSLGNYPEVSLKNARQKRDECRTWLEDGKDPKLQLQLTRTEQLKPVTVKDALEYWLTEYAEERRKNADKHRQQFAKHLYPHIGHYPLKECETRHWVECFDRIRKTAPVAAGYVLQNAKQALRFCRVRRYAESRELDDLTINDVGRKQAQGERFLSAQEIGELLNWLNKPKTLPYYRALIRLLLIFGARSQELRLSTWAEWDLANWLWTVPAEHSKTGKQIIRPIPEGLVAFLTALKAQTEESGYLLGELKTAEAVSQAGRGIWKRIGHTTSWRLHDLRRTFTTHLNDLGVAPHVVEQLLGHTLAGVMAVYNRSQYLPEKRDALTLWMVQLESYRMNGKGKVIAINQAVRSA